MRFRRRTAYEYDSLKKNNNLKLPEKVFWLVPHVVLAALLGFGIKLYLTGSAWRDLIPLAAGGLFTVLLMLLARLKHHYVRYFTLFCVTICGLLFPALTLLGFTDPFSAPLLTVSAVIIAALLVDRARRTLCFALVLSTNSLAAVFTYLYPDGALAPLRLDTLIGSILVAAAAYFIVSSIIDGYSRMTDILNRHMDIGKLSDLMISDGPSAPVGKLFRTAVLFADISNFTMISETMPPETVARFLNVFFDITEKCIHDNDGVLDKYIGDCTMAFWIDRIPTGDAARRACRCALAIRDRLNQVCEAVNLEFGCELECSIGINYGEAIVGDVGSVTRQDYTVIGDAVNVAARLESIAPGGTIYLSQSMAEIVQNKMTVHHVPKKVVLKGKSAPADIYTLESAEHAPGESDFVPPESAKTGYILHICGCRGSFSISGKRFAEFGGETSCYVFRKDRYALIVDCGSGLQRAREILANCTVIDIIITHLHYDHIMGLLDWSIFPAGAELRFFGNFGCWMGKDTWHQFLRPPFWPVDISRGEIVCTEPGPRYALQQDVTAVFYPSSHPNDANLVVLELAGQRICVMADCENPKDLPDSVLRHAALLIYDGMYEDQYYHEHVGWGHSTWESGVRLAQEKEVERLIISHHNTRNSDEKLRGLEKRAQELYPATTFAKAGDRFPI